MPFQVFADLGPIGFICTKVYEQLASRASALKATAPNATHMRFRLKAFGLHLLASASVLALVLGILYLGWYQWPGWYVAGVSSIVAVLIAVDLTLGPLMTFLVARSTKPHPVLMRDIGVIATVQLCALIYGSVSLWNGRPLYYAFSTSTLELIQAYGLNAHDLAVAREQHAALRPHWYSLPRWIWVPLPSDSQEAEKIVVAVTTGEGEDVTSMPQYFKPWQQGLSELRSQLKRVDDVPYFSKREKAALALRMRARGLDPTQSATMPMMGRGRPLLVVFDPAKLEIAAMIAPPDMHGPEFYRSVIQAYWKRLFVHQKTAHS